jgi:hypothetical protein
LCRKAHDQQELFCQEDGDYIFTNLAEYDDLTPGSKIVEEALKKAGK